MFGFLRPQIHDSVKRQIQDVRAEPIATRALSGPNCDTLPTISGEFGFSPNNPIPVNGVGGIFRYLGKLLNPDGNIIMFHRLGSFSSNACENSVDGFEIVGNDGRNWDVIFLSMYRPRRLNRTPSGHRFKQYNKALEDLPVAFGTWDFCNSFPSDLAPAVERNFGNAFSRRIGEWTSARSFTKPNAHLTRTALLLSDRQSLSVA